MCIFCFSLYRFKEFLKRTPGTASSQPSPSPNSRAMTSPPPARGHSMPMHQQPRQQQQQRRGTDEVEYYNDLPGKRPPTAPTTPTATTLPHPPPHKKDSTSSNLIDFSTDLSGASATLPLSSSVRPPHPIPAPISVPSAHAHEYVNGGVTASSGRDPFDMSKSIVKCV